MKKRVAIISKKNELHMTVPPRLEGAVKNKMMNPVRKKKMKKEKKKNI